MTETQADQLTIRRTNYTATVVLDGATGCWLWTVPATAPADATDTVFDETQQTLYYKLPGDDDVWRATQATSRQLTPTMLLAMLTLDEARLLMGYCAHVSDQLGTHMGFVLASMGEAMASKDWHTMRTLNSELAQTLGAQQVAIDTARQAYDCLDREPA